MESSTPTEPRPPEPPPALEEQQPATRGELQTLRRWLIVAGVWAVAATAVGVLAFLEARDAKSESSSRATQADIDRLNDKLTKEIDELRTQIDGLPTQSQVSQLQTRIRNAQRDAKAATDDATKATDDIKSLRTRVTDLESDVNSLQTAADDDSAADGN